jgi:hypothetical protein
MSCNCLWGTPVENKDGSCGCTNPVTQPAINCFIGTPKPDGKGDWYCDTSGIIKNEPLPNETKDTKLPPLAQSACASLRAPAGYQYIWTGNQCALVVNYDVDRRVPANTVSNSSGTPNVAASVQSIVANNKGLFVIGGLIAGWYLLNAQGMKPKQREVVSTTRY